MVKESTKALRVIGTGNIAGAGGAATGVYAGGITGLNSAVQIASGLKAVGSAVTLGLGGMSAGVIACMALPIVGGAAGYGLYRLYTR